MPPKKKQKKKQSGKGLKEVLKFIKDKKLISQGLGMIPHPGAQVASQVAGMIGLGKKKKKQRGRGIFSDLGGGIGNIAGGIGGGLGSIARGLFGGARQQYVQVPIVSL